MRPPLAQLLLASAVLTSCQSKWWRPPLRQEPWSMIRPGTVAVTAQPGLHSIYTIDGDFLADTPASGILTQSDDGDLAGRFGFAARAQYALSERWLLAAGLDYRIYDIDGLNPIDELDVAVQTVDSLQYVLALRYLMDPFASQPRLRPWVEAQVAYLPSVDVGFEVDLSSFGSSNLNIDTEGDGYFVGGLATGLLYQWTDRATAEIGVVYELPLSTMETDLSFSIGPSTVPMFGELNPEGVLIFTGITWYL